MRGQGAALAPVAPPPATYEQKMAAILRLEDRRMIEAPPAPPPAVTSLTALLTDDEGRVRRRAALGLGRAGLADGVAPLVGPLAADPEPEVRPMAAFALGLIGDAAAAAALTTALADADPRVQGRAAEALGLIGAQGRDDADRQMVLAHVRAGALAGVDSDELGHPLAPPIEAVRLGIYALVRLGDVAALRTVVQASDGSPASDWWPFAYAMQRIGHADALPVLRVWLRRGGVLTRAFAVKGLGGLKDQGSRAALESLAGDARQPTSVRVQAVRGLGAIADARSAPVLTALLPPPTPGALRLEAAAAIGASPGRRLAEPLIDYLEDDWAPMRARGAIGAGQERRRRVHAGAVRAVRRSGMERARGAGDDARGRSRQTPPVRVSPSWPATAIRRSSRRPCAP